MNTIELSLLIKTFVRPICLDNLLKSVQEYQNFWNLKFDKIVVIDDSDAENGKENEFIVSKYETLNILYKKYEFNSLGLSKGRNIGLSFINTKYFLLCDDDFILDINCSLLSNIELMEVKKLDILGGVYRNISSINDKNYTLSNWLGFINENKEFDLCTIYSNLFPEFIMCDICQNIFIAKTDSVKLVLFPEDLPVLEHNIFYLRAKQKGLKVASSSKLYVKHLHLNNKTKGCNYSSYRNREVINPINKKVIGTLISDEAVYLFEDYLNVAKNKYVKEIIKTKKNILKFIFSVTNEQKNIKRKVITILGFKIKFKCDPYRKQIEKIKKQYPQVMSTTDTLLKIIEDRKSIARFGDGEIKLLMGLSLGERGKLNEYQVYDKELMEKLKYILKNPLDNCLVCIDAFKDKYNDIQNYTNGLSYWENFWLDYFDKVSNLYNKNYVYGMTSTTRNTGFIENNINEYRKIWNQRKVLFVIGEGSHWVNEKRLFSNVLDAKYLVTKGKSTYDEYEEIITQIKNFNQEWLILLAIGPTSTVLAYELSKVGYQALDIGHLPNCYLQAIGERESPEIEHWKNKQFNLKKGLYDNL